MSNGILFCLLMSSKDLIPKLIETAMNHPRSGCMKINEKQKAV